MGERCISAEGVKLSGASRQEAEPYADTTLESPARAPKVHDGWKAGLISQAKGQSQTQDGIRPSQQCAGTWSRVRLATNLSPEHRR